MNSQISYLFPLSISIFLHKHTRTHHVFITTRFCEDPVVKIITTGSREGDSLARACALEKYDVILKKSRCKQNPVVQFKVTNLIVK